MSTSLLSTLSRGYGPWMGSIDNKHENLPSLDSNTAQHRHGPTVLTKDSTTFSGVPIADDGHLELPKTFLTRKGALILFTAPDELPVEPPRSPRLRRKRHKQKDFIDLSLKLRTLERLSLSVLQFGDKSYDKESASITDRDNSLFLSFLHDLSKEKNDSDAHSQPGGDFKFYVRDLKRRASCRFHGARDASPHRARSAELQELLDELEQVWPHTSNQREDSIATDGNDFFYPASPALGQNAERCLSRHRVLSSKKLAGSLKSINYMGRPFTADGSFGSLRAPQNIRNGRAKSAVSAVWGSDFPSSEKQPKSKHQAQNQLRSISDKSKVFDSSSRSYSQAKIKDITSWGEDKQPGDVSDENEDMQSQSGTEIEIKISGKHTSHSPSKLDKVYASTQSDLNNDIDAMLAEAASVLSSLAEDEDIDVPYGDLSETEEDFQLQDEWPGEQHDTLPRRRSPIVMSRIKQKQPMDPGLAQPLRPQYSNVMDVDDSSSTADRDAQTGIESNYATPFPSSRVITPTSGVTGDQAEEQDTAPVQPSMATDNDQLDEASLQIKREEERAAKLAALDYLLRPTNPPPVEIKSEETPLEEIEEEVFVELEKAKPPAPKRREQPVEVKKALIEDEVKEVESTDNRREEDVPQISERVLKEKEERERKSAKLREDKEKAEMKKKEEEEKLRQQKEEKAKAAEERLKTRAAEAARKKEEDRKKQEEEAVSEIHLVPIPPAAKKPGTVTRGKGVKPGKKEVKGPPKTQFVKPLDIIGSQQEDAKSLQTSDNLKSAPVEKLQRTSPKLKIAAQKEEPEVPEHLIEMFARKTEQEAEQEMEEEILKMKLAVDNALGESVVESEGTEGLTEEDFKLAQEALMAKIKMAEEDILENASPRAEVKNVSQKKAPKPEKKVPVSRKKKIPEVKRDPTKEREAMKEKERQEKQRRLEEARALQQKIHLKEEARKAKEAEAKRKAEELKERMEAIREEEAELERAEQDAREQLAAVRKAQREEREARRKADLERKKNQAIEKREKEKAMARAAREKEQEMLDSIADAEMARRLKEEEEAKREEEEMAAQEKFEAELLEAQKAAEEEEEKLRELERQAEEEAFQRIINEKEEAEERRWKLEEQARNMREEEERLQREMLEEEQKLEEERRKKEDEEEMRRNQEKGRLEKLQQMEEEARERLRAELDKRRAWALQRREQNLKVRAYIDAIRQTQGITEPWTFSYFVKWPKESYMRPMGQDPKKNKGPQKPRPKPPAPAEVSADTAVDQSAVEDTVG
ncbi:unnamed protein product [Lymnaea stagnalis]|uniref:Uncharacterized protein n=1 Tax=Lymnaea stagnalis TaxID=6523 RepID=A0AAV2IGD0_LYMST